MQMVGHQYVKPDLPGIGRLPCRPDEFVNRGLGQPLLASAGAGGQKHDGGLPKTDVNSLSRSSATDIFVWDIADHGRRLGIVTKMVETKGEHERSGEPVCTTGRARLPPSRDLFRVRSDLSVPGIGAPTPAFRIHKSRRSH